MNLTPHFSLNTSNIYIFGNNPHCVIRTMSLKTGNNNTPKRYQAIKPNKNVTNYIYSVAICHIFQYLYISSQPN